MQARIRFKAFGSSTAFGSFGPGDRLTCSQELAKHLVEQAGVAEYEVPLPQGGESESGGVAATPKPAARRGRKPAA